MNLYLDIKYLSLISNRLPRFAKKNDLLWNCRCTICGDSSTKKNKARGFFYVKSGKMFYMCHNCGASMSFYSFLKQTDNLLANQYAVERFKNKVSEYNPFDTSNQETGTDALDIFGEDPEPTKPQRLIDSLMDRLDTLPEDNVAVEYALSRKIPREKFSEIYYVDNVKNLEQLSEKYRNKIIGEEPRLVLPFYDWNGMLCGLTARDILGKSSLRYIEMKIKENVPLIFGTETIDPSKEMYVVEGPIDSLFIDNCIAVAGTGFTKLDDMRLDKTKVTVIIDNQPRNRDVCRVYQKFIEKGYKVVIWPQTLIEKDINEIIESGVSKEQLMVLINKNTHQGLSAKAAFLAWKKI